MALSALACGGNRAASGDHAGQLNGRFTITPPNATVIIGQPFQFTASSSWGNGAAWAVLPATGGTIDATGNFQASGQPGDYQIVAMWNHDVRYTATASVTVVDAPLPALINPSVVQAFGGHQQSADERVRNDSVAGETVPAKDAVSGTSSIRVRHGFAPPIAQ